MIRADLNQAINGQRWGGWQWLGEQASAINALGTHGPALAYLNVVENGWTTQTVLFWVLSHTLTTLSVAENGDWSGTATADGTYQIVGDIYVDGVQQTPSVTVFVAIGVSAWTAGSDSVAGGWTPSTGASLSACVDESALSRLDYITSADLSTSCTLNWSAAMPAGTYNVLVDALYVLASGKMRIVCLDASNAVVGSSAWQTLTASAATYSLPITTSAPSTKFRIEVQP